MNVLIIGGGASGMIAAITAARDKNNKITLLERQARVGRKLLATGNGRCNLTNTSLPEGHYHGGGAALACSTVKGFDELAFFSSLGLVSVEQYGGRVYPLSDSAGSVLDVLRLTLDASGVEVKTGEEVRTAGRRNGRFYVTTESAVYDADKLIVACGGMAGGKIGGVRSGYDILRSFGHGCTKLYPALVPVFTQGDITRSLKGIRADAEIRLGSSVSRGELLFTERGISGPAAFDISRLAATDGGMLEINFLPNAEDILPILKKRCTEMSSLEAGSIFAGILHSRLGMAVVKYSGIRPSSLCGTLSSSDIDALAHNCSHFRLEVKGVGSFDDAQITVGGIDTKQFNPATLESLLCEGLYACGEVLDVDADCGGYNLRWAWASGHLAGLLK